MKIGFTTTIPVEVIFASENIPIDLNNIFITSDDYEDLVDFAENDGFPRNVCAWIKGLYSTIIKLKAVDAVVAVSEGDCTNTKALMEVLQANNIKTIPFYYPAIHTIDKVKDEIDRFIAELGTTIESVNAIKIKLDEIRKKLNKIDELTYKNNLVFGEENHLFLVNASDFKSDFLSYEKEIDNFIEIIKEREPLPYKIRLGFLGVPPILTDIYKVINNYGANVVFNEIQRQFAMLSFTENIYKQYYLYTYPYDIFFRLEDIKKEIKKRKLHGIIHYTQTFCHRQIEDILIRKNIDIPVLTIEGDRPGKVDERTKIRIQSFIELLRSKYDIWD